MTVQSRAQLPPVMQWQRVFGGGTNDQIYGFQWTGDGFVVGGPSQSLISGNKTSPNYGSSDFWILRLDAEGNRLWENTYGGTSGDTLTCLKKTSDNGYILCGTSISPISGTKTSAPYGSSGDFWLVKIDATGNQTWDNSYGGTSIDLPWSVEQTQDGYVMAGVSYSGVNGNKTAPNYGSGDVWVVRVDASGNKLWDKSFGGTGYEESHRVLQTADGGFIVAAYSDSGISGNKTNASFGGSDYWLIRLDSDGNKLWEKEYGGNGTEYLYDLKITSDGGFVLAGSSTSGISGNKTSANIGGQDVWVVRTDSNGVILWQKVFGGTGPEEPNSIQQTSDGGFIVGGYSYSGPSGGKTSANYGLSDAWVLRLDSDGNKLWENSYGGTLYDFAAGVTQTTDGGYLFAGYSSSGVSGNKSQTGFGGYDCWIVKVGPERPTLTGVRVGNSFKVSWPDWKLGFQLQQASSVSSASWSSVTNASTTNAGVISVSLPFGNGIGFYRLAK